MFHSRIKFFNPKPEDAVQKCVDCGGLHNRENMRPSPKLGRAWSDGEIIDIAHVQYHCRPCDRLAALEAKQQQKHDVIPMPFMQSRGCTHKGPCIDHIMKVMQQGKLGLEIIEDDADDALDAFAFLMQALGQADKPEEKKPEAKEEKGNNVKTDAFVVGNVLVKVHSKLGENPHRVIIEHKK